MSTPIFGITGWKNSGKTTLLTELVSEFTDRGLRVSTIKHAHHAFDIDHKGTDSYRHREAGATEVVLISGRRWALMHELRDEREPSLQEIIPQLAPCDLILIEGYKREAHPKIEARRTQSKDRAPLTEQDPHIVGVAADHPVEEGTTPVFALDDITGMADFIAEYLQLESRNALA
ncbi:MAG: molybdopterin-guanine dinucleotide biosynthesis protein B [Stappiaceae bacterium]